MSRRLSPAQAAEVLGTSPRTVRELIRAGRLPAIDISTVPGRHRYRISEADLERFLDGATVIPAATPRRRRPRRLPPVKQYV